MGYIAVEKYCPAGGCYRRQRLDITVSEGGVAFGSIQCTKTTVMYFREAENCFSEELEETVVTGFICPQCSGFIYFVSLYDTSKGSVICIVKHHKPATLVQLLLFLLILFTRKSNNLNNTNNTYSMETVVKNSFKIIIIFFSQLISTIVTNL